MEGTTRERVLAVLDERDVGLPDDRLTPAKIRDRAYGFRFEPDEELSFRVERHPTMYLSDTCLPGLDATPARFHVVREYRLDLSGEVWQTEELSSTFEYEPWMVVEAEVATGAVAEAIRAGIEEIRAADDPEAAFEDEFGWVIDYWEEKFENVDGRKVPEEDREAIVDMLVDALKERAEIDPE